MTRFPLAWAICIIFFSILGTSLLSMKTNERYDRVQTLKSQIKSDTQKITQLNNELTVLASPQRLKRLVDEHVMALQAPEPEQILVAANDLSLPEGMPTPQLAQIMPTNVALQKISTPYVIALTKPEPKIIRQPPIMLAAAPARGRLVSFAEEEPLLITLNDAPKTGIMTISAPHISSQPPRAAIVAEASVAKKIIAAEVSATPVIHKIKPIAKPKAPRIEFALQDEKPIIPKKSIAEKPNKPTPPASGLSSNLIQQINLDAAKEQKR
jgi:hypothetical protein